MDVGKHLIGYMDGKLEVLIGRKHDLYLGYKLIDVRWMVDSMTKAYLYR